MKFAKQIISKALRASGYELRKIGDTEDNLDEEAILHALMFLLLSARGRLTLVEIGANDGLINDPLYNFVVKFGVHLNVILIEPQSSLIPILEKNYRFQESKLIINSAIGPKGVTTMYGVKESVWHQLDVPYAKNWPPYRAPTGIVSSDRDRVIDWLNRYLPKHVNAEASIDWFEVASEPLSEALRETRFDTVDYLQVDAEGFDDLVLFNSNLEQTRPYIICFEDGHLSCERQNVLRSYLMQLGYVCLKLSHNSVAFLSDES